MTEVSLTHRDILAQLSAQLQLSPNIRRSFARADPFVEAKDSTSQTAWYPVEISWTAAPRDLERDRRNAGLLRQATGQPAYALVAGHRYEEYMDWTNVQWIDLSDD